MIIAVGSKNKHKLQAVRVACKKAKLGSVKIMGFETKSYVDEQPVGFDKIRDGATNRACSARHQSDYGSAVGIGIESGIIKFDDNYFDLAVVVVIYASMKIVTTSVGIQFPSDCVLSAKARGFEKVTVGSVIAEKTGCDKTDPHSHLTNCAMSRTEALAPAIAAVLGQLPTSKKGDRRGKKAKTAL